MLASTAMADGNVTIRGAYYKEEATKVAQPTLDAELEVGESGQLLGHALVDSITSASAASGATGAAFTERRLEGGLVYVHSLKRFRIGGGFRYSTEPDYVSRFASFQIEADFAQRNTTLALNVALGADDISNAGAQGGLSTLITKELTTSLLAISATQLLTPVSMVGISYDVSYLSGFQANIYRTVVAGGTLQSERLPDKRLRHAFAANYRYFVEPSKTALIASYRFYVDDWGVLGHTPELRIAQEFGSDLDLDLSYRYYRQGPADFYQEMYDSADPLIEPFLSGDDKLGNARTHLLGFKLGADLSILGITGSWKHARVEALVQYLVQNTHYGNALISQVALTIPLHY